MEQNLQLPEGFLPMANQVAGHSFTDQTEGLGMLMQENSNCVLKPLGKPECGKRELNFYETLLSSTDQQIIKLKPLVPRFYNKVNLLVNQKLHTFIKLEDITYNMEKPCIMDVKIGKRTWDPIATVEKRKVEEQKYLKCKQTLGLCLPGFQMFYNENSTYKLKRYGKEYGKQLDEDGFRETMAIFLNSKHTICRQLIEEVLSQLYAIRNWFNIQNKYHFYASSILIAYDAAKFSLKSKKTLQETVINGYSRVENGTSSTKNIIADAQNSENINIKDFVRVRMIDFAHVFPAEGGALDTNYLFGLRNLITILEELLHRSPTTNVSNDYNLKIDTVPR